MERERIHRDTQEKSVRLREHRPFWEHKDAALDKGSRVL